MTLSNRDVRRRLNRDFVCAWENTDGDLAAGSSFAHSPSEPPPSCVRGNGEHNLQILFFTQDGELLNAVAGFIDPDAFLKELDFALELAKAVGVRSNRDGEPDAESQREDCVRSAHERLLERLDPDAFPGTFGSFELQRVKSDHRFVAKNPLLAARDFKTEAMVGNGRTFFGSSNGPRPGELLGEVPELPKGFGDDLLDDLLRKKKPTKQDGPIQDG